MDIYKSFYQLAIPHYDAILGIPFFENEEAILNMVNKTVRTKHGTVALENNEELGVIQVATISRRRLKAMVRRDDIDSLYLGMTRLVDEDSEPTESPTEPAWVRKEYGDIFLDGLPPGLPPKRAVDHQIPLIQGLPPPFKGIFRLSQQELHELKKQVEQLLDEGKRAFQFLQNCWRSRCNQNC